MTDRSQPWILDLDGVVWRGDRPVRGAADAVAELGERGHPVRFCTNNSATTPADYVERLRSFGIPVDGPEQVLTSALAVARLVEPGARVLCVSGAGVREAVADRRAVVVRPGDADGADLAAIDVVVVGFHREFDYAALRAATRAVLAGARLLASNDDPIYPDTDGPAPGCGAILAAVERAGGRRASVAGKPHAPMAQLVLERVGGAGSADARADVAPGGVVVGDSPGTDGGLAARLGWRFGLVLSGNTTAGDPEAVTAAASDPDWVAEDLATLVARHG